MEKAARRDELAPDLIKYGRWEIENRFQHYLEEYGLTIQYLTTKRTIYKSEIILSMKIIESFVFHGFYLRCTQKYLKTN